MKEIIKNIFEKIEFSIIIKTLYYTTIFFTLFPDSLLKKIYLLDFKNNYKFIFSISFIILTCYYLSLLFEYIKKKVKNKLSIKKRINVLKKISVEEQQYIMEFYNFEKNYFDTSAEFDISDAIVSLLEHKMIIGRGSSLSIGYSTFSYFLQPWAQEYLNNQLSLNNIKVTKKDFTWNLK